MAAYFLNNNSACEYGFSVPFDKFSRDLGAFNGGLRGGSVSQSQALVLDSEKGELVQAPLRVAKKNASEAKVLAALKSHSEAERRRRERINAHLDTLRGLVPCREKMDKATLLGEVIRQVKELKRNAIEASKGYLIPIDADEVRVELCDDEADGVFSFKASVCCDYRPELLSDMRRSLGALPLNMMKANISTLGNRIKTDFVFTSYGAAPVDDSETRQLLSRSIHHALSSVLEKESVSPEYSPRTTHPNKRRRISFFDSSSSSS